MIDKSLIKRLSGTIFAASIVTIFLCQPHNGFIAFFEVIILIPWVIMWIWRSIKTPELRLLYAVKMCIWILSIGITISVHFFIAYKTRQKAQMVVNAILDYHRSHGSYPPDIQTIGYSKDDLRSMIGMNGYSFNQNKPNFYYASTYMIFETESYDFSKREWQHNYD